jgi:hypothetical protein
VTFSKCLALLLSVTLDGTQNELKRYYIYMILGVWLICVAFWLNRLDTGLKLYPPLFIIPVMQVGFIFFAILCGGTYFREFDNFTAIQFIGFGSGVFLILVGVYGLAPKGMQLEVPTDTETDEEAAENKEETPKETNKEKNGPNGEERGDVEREKSLIASTFTDTDASIKRYRR